MLSVIALTRVKLDKRILTTLPVDVSVPKYAYWPLGSITAEKRSSSPDGRFMDETLENAVAGSGRMLTDVKAIRVRDRIRKAVFSVVENLKPYSTISSGVYRNLNLVNDINIRCANYCNVINYSLC